MLIIAQPRSASTSLIDTLGKITGKKCVQIFNQGGKSYKDIYPIPDGYAFLHKHHSDFRPVPVDHILKIAKNQNVIRKQHFPPTNNILEGIKNSGIPVVVLLRDPKQGMESYRKLGSSNYEASLEDLQRFYVGYNSLAGCWNVLIITYDDLTTQFHQTIIRVLNHFGLSVPGNILDVKLSRKNVGNERYQDYLKNRRIAFIGPAPTLKGLSKGSLIDSYDIVIRMKQPIVPDALHIDYGKRTDVIYCNLNNVGYEKPIETYFGDWKLHGLKWLIMCRRKKNRNRALSGKIEQHFGYRRITKGFYSECKAKCNCVGKNIPFTGTVAILDLLRMPFKELYITGFNYYKNSIGGENGHYSGFNPDKFEGGVDYKKYYNTIYSKGSADYRHNANNDIMVVRHALYATSKNVVVGDDLKNAIG